MNLDKLEVAFKPWPKIPRGQGETITITEKMDGTNSCIVIEDGQIVGIQSRNKNIQPAILSGDRSSDNAGFAAWVMENEEDLLGLGEGYHYGEWCGPSIQKNPHQLDKKTFYLFNVHRWNDDNPNRPVCCEVVPTVYQAELTDTAIQVAMNRVWLIGTGRGAIPEGVIVYFHKTKRYEKHTFANQQGKWLDKEIA